MRLSLVNLLALMLYAVGMIYSDKAHAVCACKPGYFQSLWGDCKAQGTAFRWWQVNSNPITCGTEPTLTYIPTPPTCYCPSDMTIVQVSQVGAPQIMCNGVSETGGTLGRDCSREPVTSTSSASSTSTSSTSATNTVVSSVSTAISSATDTAVETITEIANTTTGNQAESIKALGNVMLTGASHQANAALLLCAQGANREVEVADSGVDDIASCGEEFAKADEMTKAAEKAGVPVALKRDEGMLSQESAVTALEKFEKNFGVQQADYVDRMLSSHSRNSDFSDMLSSKFSIAKLDKLFSSVSEAAPLTVQSQVSSATDTPKPLAKSSSNTSLRDSLKEKLRAMDENGRNLAAAKDNTDDNSTPIEKEKLQPANIDWSAKGSEDFQEAESTIFDVIHSKLTQLKLREKI